MRSAMATPSTPRSRKARAAASTIRARVRALWPVLWGMSVLPPCRRGGQGIEDGRGRDRRERHGDDVLAIRPRGAHVGEGAAQQAEGAAVLAEDRGGEAGETAADGLLAQAGHHLAPHAARLPR